MKWVSTHSRPKAAGCSLLAFAIHILAFQLTAARRRLAQAIGKKPFLKTFQLTAARRRLAQYAEYLLSNQQVSTHSRPKAAGG